MRTTLFSLLTLMFIVVTNAGNITQKGYVRTIGRPDNRNGEPLSGVTLKVQGQHTLVKSDSKGNFSLIFPNAKDGEAYKLNSVRLSGYELNEKEVIGRDFIISSGVTQEIVMISLRVKQEIENNIRSQVESRYMKQLRKLEAEKSALGEQYYAEMRRLETVYEKRDALIADMVERYSHTDYAKLDETSARINTFIESGELERADSVIKTMNVAKLEHQHSTLEKDIVEKRTSLQKEENALNNIKNELATAYNGKFEIFQAQFQNDSAAFYIKKLAALDSTNIDYQIQAANFISTYLAKYDEALKFLHNAQSMASDSITKARVYNSLGIVNQAKGELDLALEYHQKALDIDIQQMISGDIATSFSNISLIYNEKGNYDLALKYGLKSLEIRQDLGDEYDVAYSCYNIGNSYLMKRNYDLALDYFLRCIKLHHSNNLDPLVAMSYNSIGQIYNRKENFDLALENFQKALDIRQKIYGDQHPFIAASYNNVGLAFLGKGLFDSALKYFYEALQIGINIYGEWHYDIATYYFNIGTVYYRTKNFDLALENFQKALNIDIKVLGEEHPNIAYILVAFGDFYYNKDDLDQALEYFNKALSILEKSNNDIQYITYIYSQLGYIYLNKKDYESAIKYFNKYIEACNKIRIKVNPIYENGLRYSKYKFALNSKDKDNICNLLKTNMAMAQVSDGTPASERGLSGEYYLVQYEDWNMESTIDFFDYIVQYKGKPKTIVLYRNGEFYKEYFADIIGIYTYIKEVKESERVHILKEWEKWLKNNE